jgi:hypothetical protein
MVLTLQLMDGGKEALEKFAREAVALYGRDAPEMLLHRAELAHLYGDPLAATWHEVAAIAARITRRTDRSAEPSPVRPPPSPAPRRISESSHVLRKKGSGRR